MVHCLLQQACIVWSKQGILVVDDDKFLALMVAELLETKGYRVWTACDGLEGCSIYYQHQEIQTVLTDIDMPELDGFRMMHCIRDINPSAKVIYMSGAPERYRRALVAEARNFGASTLRKPFEDTELLTLVSVLQDKARARAA